jgi:hypothetical protein
MKTFTQLTEQSNEEIIAIYLDWVNNFLSLDKFADHYGLDEIDAYEIIELGRILNNEKATKNKLEFELLHEGYEIESIREFLDEHFQNLLSFSENKKLFINWIEN